MPAGLPRIGRATVAVVALGLLLTAGLTYAAARAHDANEDRLLEEQAEEATAVLQAAVPRILANVAQVARVVDLLEGDPVAMERELAGDIREDAFVSLTVVRRDDRVRLVELGDASKLDDDDLAEVLDSTGPDPGAIHVTAYLDGDEDRRLAYTTDVPSVGLAVLAEAQLTSPRISEDREGAAFEGVDVAIYLGGQETGTALLTSTTPDLPIDGRRASRTVPLGDTVLLFVVTPVSALGGGLLAVLPWLTAAAGLLSGGIGAVLVESVHRRRLDAERFTEELQELFRRERTIAHTLQHSLLPTHLDQLRDIEVGARYFPGAEGTEIGGDWYDVINSDGTFTVVVGDVVGRGVTAAAVMAAMRYATHAIAGQTGEPAEILAAINDLEHIRGDFVTVLCGNVDLATRTIRFASAGHPAPLLITPDETRYLRIVPGPPIGFLDHATYQVKRAALPPGSVVVLFTDGLYERRGESIEVGLERLRTAASGQAGRPVQEILDALAETMLVGGVRDDTAMLAFRV